MAIDKKDLYKMVDCLNNNDKKAVFDFMQFLIERSINKTPPSWQEIDKLEPDSEPLTESEIEQLKSEEGYISGEDAKNEFGLQVRLP